MWPKVVVMLMAHHGQQLLRINTNHFSIFIFSQLATPSTKNNNRKTKKNTHNLKKQKKKQKKQKKQRDLQSALNVASDGNNHNIWIAQGTYYPTITSNDRSISFNIPNNVNLYGGFNGNEASIEDRPGNLQTILDGNIGDKNINTDNSYHILKISQNTNLDSLIIQNGYTNNQNNIYGIGQGVCLFVLLFYFL